MVVYFCLSQRLESEDGSEKYSSDAQRAQHPRMGMGQILPAPCKGRRSLLRWQSGGSQLRQSLLLCSRRKRQPLPLQELLVQLRHCSDLTQMSPLTSLMGTAAVLHCSVPVLSCDESKSPALL